MPSPKGLIPTPQQAQEEGRPPSDLCPRLQPHSPTTGTAPATLALAGCQTHQACTVGTCCSFCLEHSSADLCLTEVSSTAPSSWHLPPPGVSQFALVFTARPPLPPHCGMRRGRRAGPGQLESRLRAGPARLGGSGNAEEARVAGGRGGGVQKTRPPHGGETEGRDRQEPRVSRRADPAGTPLPFPAPGPALGSAPDARRAPTHLGRERCGPGSSSRKCEAEHRLGRALPPDRKSVV